MTSNETVPTEQRVAAAFFDLDRTLISRPTPLALASTFRRRGLLTTRDLARATLWQLLFLLPGVDGTRRASVDGMTLLKGLPVATLQEILGEAMETVLRPLLFAEPLELLERHRAAGEPTYIVSASLHEIVQYVADDLGFDGAIGSTCEIVDGVFTGVSLQPCTAPTRHRPSAGSPIGTGSTSRPRPGTPTRPATSPSSKRWALRSRSIPTASSARSRAAATGPSSDSRRSSCLDRPEHLTSRIFTIPVRPSHCIFIVAALDESHDPLDPAHQHPHRDPRLPAARDVRDPPALEHLTACATTVSCRLTSAAR